MRLTKFKQVIENTPEEEREHIELSMHILDRIHELLNKKFGGKQKLLAEKMGKSEAEISKWLSGVQNFTTRTIVKLELAFGEKILSVRSEEEDTTFEQVKCTAKTQHAKLAIDGKGSMQAESKSYEDLHFDIKQSQKQGNLMI